MRQPIDIAILGATGEVGETMIAILEERKFPVKNLYALASENSAGASLFFNNKRIVVQDAANFDFHKVQIALFSAGGAASKKYAPKATAAGCIVIDNTSQFRYVDQIPLVIPEVNEDALAQYTNNKIIANPNCSTIQMLVALKPIYDAVGIEKIHVATYQAVSGTGKRAISELASQAAALLNGMPIEQDVYPHQIAFNVIPHIDEFMDNGFTKEEMTMYWETRKILDDQNISVSATTVRVPVFYGHSEAVHIEMQKPLLAAEAKTILRSAPGVILIDEPNTVSYPTPAVHAVGKDSVFVGRVRNDLDNPKGLNLWIVADNIRKGAALNSIQIAEILLNKYISL